MTSKRVISYNVSLPELILIGTKADYPLRESLVL